MQNNQHQSNTKVFLVGLNPYFTKQAITKFFAKKHNCRVKKLKFLSKKIKGKMSSGCAMMELYNKVDVKRLLAIDCFRLQDRKFFVKPFLQGKQRKKFKEEVRKRRVFIHNVNPDLSTKDVRLIFGYVAEIEDAFLISKTKNNKQHGRQKREYSSFSYGYVMFKHIEDAAKWKKIGQLRYRGANILISPYKDSGKMEAESIKINQEPDYYRAPENKGGRLPYRQRSRKMSFHHNLNLGNKAPQNQTEGRGAYDVQNISSYGSMNRMGWASRNPWRSDLPKRKISDHICRLEFGNLCPKCDSINIERNHHRNNILLRMY